MKRIALFALLVASLGSQAQKGDKKKIEGSGNVITRDITISSFNELEAGGVFDLRLKQGDREQVRIEADDNLQEYFTVKNEGSKLVIQMKKEVNIHSKKKMNVYVTFKNLKALDLRMVGSTYSDETLNFTDLRLDNQSVGSVKLSLSAKSLQMENESVGSVSLSGRADNAVIKSSSVGSIKAGEFVVKKMEIRNDGVGSAEVNATQELVVRDSFLGKVSNKGAAAIKKSNKTEI